MTDAEDLPETYVDSRGAEVVFVSFSEALDTVHGLASKNIVDDLDMAFGDTGLRAQHLWQKSALDTLEDFVTNHCDGLDELNPSEKAGQWPEDVLRADRNLDPNEVLNAIKICLAMAEASAIDPSTVSGVGQADECDRQQIAFDVTGDLIGMHGSNLAEIKNITLPSDFFKA